VLLACKSPSATAKSFLGPEFAVRALDKIDRFRGWDFQDVSAGFEILPDLVAGLWVIERCKAGVVADTVIQCNRSTGGR